MAGGLLTCAYYELYGVKQPESFHHAAASIEGVTMDEAHPPESSGDNEKPNETSLVPTEPAETADLRLINQQLQQENKRIKAQLNALATKSMTKKSSRNVPKQLQSIFEHQRRDDNWASEVELFAEDFLYEAQLHDTINLLSAECKLHVCQLNFIAPEGEPQWQQLHTALLRMPWMKQFKTVAAVQNTQAMQIHLSLKSSDELSREY
ncbi:hypothetical protein [Pseudoalteromonas luteoviolacea]|uniref:hypothetical protein n=1 Tax=Pseudoalteromonas luteoviolacea TaxID=43657 RepID=UPI001B3771CC|nr:hypothetical protein [Pseudoalteromonas luteoviolacea]MBQ4837761.1 hypothetical protein [Pseudoalteromonas luteoviolacea]